MKIYGAILVALVCLGVPKSNAFTTIHSPKIVLKPSSSTSSFSTSRSSSSSSPTLLSMTNNNASKSPIDFFSGFFSSKNPIPTKPKLPDVVIDSDFTLSYAFAAIGIFILLTSPSNSCNTDASSFICPPSLWGILQGGLNLLFAAFLAVQAQRIRFVFDETAFELKNVDDLGSSNEQVLLKNSGENFVVGGANRWRYDSFVNYDFFPSVDFPILVYFKETQTPPEKWGEGPGGLDKVGGGQVHFFPAIANVKQLKEQFETRGCAKKE